MINSRYKCVNNHLGPVYIGYVDKDELIASIRSLSEKIKRDVPAEVAAFHMRFLKSDQLDIKPTLWLLTAEFHLSIILATYGRQIH